MHTSPWTLPPVQPLRFSRLLARAFDSITEIDSDSGWCATLARAMLVKIVRTVAATLILRACPIFRKQLGCMRWDPSKFDGALYTAHDLAGRLRLRREFKIYTLLLVEVTP